MRKNKLFLSLIAVCSIVGMGITSCNSEPVQGPQGEQGPVGPQGPAGENGENGQDGSIIHHGEGKPTDTLGKDTDVYIDSKTGDLYQKQNGSWTLVMNIKGEDGEDGQDGSDGSNGSDGQDGETAYSNTILPSDGIVIGQNVGSAVVNSTFTLTAQDVDTTDDKDLVGLILQYSEEKVTKSIELSISEASSVENGVYTWEGITMVKNGYVISAKYGNNTSASDENALSEFTIADGEENYLTLNADITVSSTFVTSKLKFISTSKETSLIIDGNGKTLDLSAASSGITLFDFSSFNGTVTLKNIKIKANSENSICSFRRTTNNLIGNILIENVDFSESSSLMTIQLVTDKERVDNNFSTVIRGCTFNQSLPIVVDGGLYGLYSNLTIENNTFNYTAVNHNHSLGYINVCVGLSNAKISGNTYNVGASETTTQSLLSFDGTMYRYVVTNKYEGFDFENVVLSNNTDSNPQNSVENEYYIDDSTKESAQDKFIWLTDTIYSYISSGDIVFENAVSSNAKSYEFIDGKLYKLAVFNEDGTLDEENSIPSEVTFSKNTDGTGLTEDSPIIINNAVEFMNINNQDVINSGAVYFKLNIGFTINNILPLSGRQETVIDLNGYQLNVKTTGISSLEKRITSLVNGQKLTLKDSSGKKSKIIYNLDSNPDAVNNNDTCTCFEVKSGAILNLDGVDLEVDTCAIFPRGDAAEINVINSNISAVTYAISTNSKGPENFGVEINVENSTLKSKYATGLLVNVPSTVNVSNSKIYGSSQACFFRSGDITLKNVDLYLNGDYDEDSTNLIGTFGQHKFLISDWEDGNNVPFAFIVIGDRGNINGGYKGDTNVTLEGITFTDQFADDNYYPRYIIGHMNSEEDGETRKVTLNIDRDLFDKMTQDNIMLENVDANFDVNELPTSSSTGNN